jgi:uncharacterized membrane protein
MLVRLFELLFKYRPVVFEEGTFTLDIPRHALPALLVAGGAAAYAVWTYTRLAAPLRRDRFVLAGVRFLVLAIVVFCLLRPMLVLKGAVPQQNFLGVLVDDSRSMQIADRGREPRSEFVHRNLALPDSPLVSALSKKFVLRFFRFSSSADRVGSPGELTYGGTRTDLGEALDRARDELSGLPLAGLAMISDGADTTNATLDASLASLRARSIPVFTVGVGEERFTHDIQISRIETPRSALKGTSLVANVVVTATGYAGVTVPLQVEDEGRLISTQDVTLPPDGESTTVRARFTMGDAGPRILRIRIPPDPREQVTQNNTREALIEVNDRREKILYFEGEPRPEAKFVRIAADGDPNLQVVVLQRTAKDKYLRQNVDNPDELVSGFPKTRDELFAYRGIILGSVEADSFTPEQLRMLADFVSRRGGGLLALGGRRSFAQGGWAGTPVADVLPVTLEAGGGQKPDDAFAELTIRPTTAGSAFPVTQIAENDAASAGKWSGMPQLSSVNPVRTVKPGATVLLTGNDGRSDERVVLAYQRYGRGKALAFSVQDSWMWRMDAKMSVSDTTYSTFWRRLIRWLIDGVPDRVEVATEADRVDPGEPIRLTAQVGDAAYLDVNDARVEAHVVAPSGKSTDVPLDWTVSRDGEYRGSFVPNETGVYQVRVVATRGGQELGSGLAHARVTSGDSEYFDASMRAPLLRRIAEETGGRYFAASDVASLPDTIGYSGRGVTVIEEHDLWDMPVLLLVLLAAVCSEWGYRRARGLA